jgi:hypothetical protein
MDAPRFAATNRVSSNPHAVDTNGLPPRSMLTIDFGVFDSR